jgi:predicted HicB family RNase H-like nuclease
MQVKLMKKGLEYKGYWGNIELDPDDLIFYGTVLGIKDVITFQGTTVDELIQAFQDSIDEYLDWCEERGENPEKPFSGRFNLRIDPELHRQLSIEANLHHESLNAYIEHILQFYAQKASAPSSLKS